MVQGVDLMQWSKHPRAQQQGKVKSKGRGNGKSSLNEDSASQSARITQDTDTWDRPFPMDEEEVEEYETGYILAAIDHRERFLRSADHQKASKR